jgi:penicillin-binding protein 1C
VTVAAKLDRPSFYEFLHNAGVSRMAREDFYGLALVLGGGEVTMQELARLYAMLANRGTLRPLQSRAGAAPVAGVRLLSDEASFMTLDMLRQNQRPDQVLAAEDGGMPVYWKTGTSWGFRDAWTAGIFGPYVLVVWVGNFDGSGNPALIGVETAAPLFFRMVDAIRAQQPGIAEPVRGMPANLRKVDVCLASGDLPNAWCPKRASTWFIPGKSPIKVSTIHRPVVIDTATGEPACPPLAGKSTRIDVYEFWPSDLARVFARAGIPRRAPPAAQCAEIEAGDGQAPSVTSPLKGGVYTVRAHREGEERIALAATVDADVSALYWFVGDAFVGSVKPGEALFWQPSAAGPYTVRVVDDHGRSDSRALQVAAVE